LKSRILPPWGHPQETLVNGKDVITEGKIYLSSREIIVDAGQTVFHLPGSAMILTTHSIPNPQKYQIIKQFLILENVLSTSGIDQHMDIWEIYQVMLNFMA